MTALHAHDFAKVRQTAIDAALPGITAALPLLCGHGGVYEIRALRGAAIASGYYDAAHMDAAALAAATLDADGWNCFFTLNCVADGALARAANRMRQDKGKMVTTGDADIVRRRWLLIDLDPKRPTGTSSSHAQWEAAHAKARAMKEVLMSEGWPEPLWASSGNGAHLLFRVDLANDKESTDLLKAVLATFARRFDDAPGPPDLVFVDTSVFNAGRISTLYGSMKRKGDDTEKFPHRRSQLLAVPDRLVVVPLAVLQAAAGTSATTVAAPSTSANDVSADAGADSRGREWMQGWLGRSGLAVGHERDKEGAHFWTLTECPFNPDHKDAAIIHGEHGFAYKCFHASCVENDWHALRAKVEHADGASGSMGNRIQPGAVAEAQPGNFAPRDPKEAMRSIGNRIVTSEDTEISEILAEIASGGLPSSGEDVLLRQLKLKHGPTLGSLRDELASAKRGGASEPKQRDQLDLACSVIAELGEGNVVYALGYFWRWQASGVWQRVDDREIKQVAQGVLNSEEAQVSKGLVDGVVDVTKNDLFRPNAPFDQVGWEQVNVANGTLEWRDGDWHLRQHRRDDYLTTQLPVPFDPAATCPRFERFLYEIFAGDVDAADKAACVIELFGYSLLTTCRFERFALLVGGGANGKSVLLGVLEALLGATAVAAVQPSQFDNRFQRAHLHGKLANIVTEIAEGAELPDAALKAIVSGELTTADHKNRDPFEFRPFATCWFGTNHMPHTRDFSEALFRRAIVLKFNNTFKGQGRDPHLKDRLLADLPGILSTSLRAIADVLRRGDFTVPLSSVEAARAWRRDVDQVAQFVDERCYLTPGGSVTSADLYRGYEEWAREAGIKHTLGRRKFTERVARLGAQASKGTGGTRMLSGIALHDGLGRQFPWSDAA